ncbi:hypothetical protein [Spiroplasma endosymbiont of Sarcophaga carnaria]|uniref:hypothetical protein n=1 Tax=Spiroplasma endosymbiont of Sarcophaga carnaria TaxID=3066303 RepID=UPI0030D48CE2
MKGYINQWRGLLVILGMTLLTTTSVMPVISCAQSEQKELTIYDQIKKSLQNTITFDDDWITDYSQPEDKIEKWSKRLINTGWTLFNKLISDLITQQLFKDVPDLLERYPDFSLSAIVSMNEFSKVSTDIKKNEQILFNYDVSYNLQQLQNIPFQDLLDSNNLLPNDKVAMIRFCVGSISVFGQYKIEGTGNQNQVLFNQKNFIGNDKKRLNYLSKMLNDTTAIKAFDGSYRKFLMMSRSIHGVRFDKSDFLTENLVKEIYDDSNVFIKNKVNILKNSLILSKTLDEIKKIINMTIWKLILCKIMILL